MPKKQRQSVSQAVAQSSQAGGGGSNSSAQAFQAFMQSMTQGTSKLMRAMQEQEIRNTQMQQQAAQQMGSQVTDVLSNMASAGQRGEEERMKRENKQGDREYAEELTLWQQDLQKDAQLWAAQLGERVKEQDERRLAYVKQHERGIEDADQTRKALRSYLVTGVDNGVFEGPGGIEKLIMIQNMVDMSDTVYEGAVSAPFLTKGIQLRNERVEELYQQEAAAQGIELTPRRPELALWPEPVQRVEGDLPVLSAGEQRDWKRGAGYPKVGISNMDPDDPMSRHINPYTMKSALLHIQNDDMLKTVTTRAGRKIIEDNTTKKVLRVSDALGPYDKMEEEMALSYEGVANEAIDLAIVDFVNDKDPSKFADPSGYITRKVIDKVMGTPEASKQADALVGGTLVLKGKDGIQVGLGYHALGMVMSNRINQSLANPNSESYQALAGEFARASGRPNTGMGDQTKMLFRQVQGTLTRVTNNFNTLKDAAWNQGPVKGLVDEVAATRRLMDTHVTVLQSEEAAEDFTPENIEKRLSSLREDSGESPEFRRNIGYLEGMAVNFKDNPNAVGAIHNLLSGGRAGVVDPNSSTYKAIVETQEKADPVYRVLRQQYNAKKSNFQLGLGVIGAVAGKGAAATGEAVGSVFGGMKAGFTAGAGMAQESAGSVQQGFQAGMQPPPQPQPTPAGPPAPPQPGFQTMGQQGAAALAQPAPMPQPGQQPQPPQNPMQQLGR